MIAPHKNYTSKALPVIIKHRWNTLSLYCLAFILTIATSFLRQDISASFGGRPLLILFMLPIIISALWGGLGPGLMATVVAAAVSDYFIFAPIKSFKIAAVNDLIQWGLLLVNGLLVSFMSELLHRSRNREIAKCLQLDEFQGELRQTETLFQKTFDLAGVGIALVMPDGRWWQVNPKLCEIVGYTSEELLELTFQDITFPDDLNTDLDLVDRVLKGDRQTYTLEKRYQRKDKSLVWINLTVTLVRNPDSSPAYFISIIENIDVRKQTEAALKNSETVLKQAQLIAGIGNWSWNIETNTHVWSEEIYRIYGRDLSLPPAVYPDIQQYFTPESWARLSIAVETALSEARNYQCDVEVVRSDGSQRWIVARGEAVQDSKGKVIKLHGTVQDITGRKQAEEEIHQLNVALEQRVLERTAELSAANHELDSFAYAVSHDMRAPLRAMSGFSQALKEDYGDQLQGEARIYLDQIGIASEKMSELIDGLLVLSRCTRGTLKNEEINLSVLSESLLAEMARNEPERQVETRVESGLIVHGDACMIELVMQNLLNNAWKYTANRPTASIQVFADKQNGSRRFCVADNGAGFDMAYANRLFQPFQRLHRQEEFPGTGIGLATVQRIIQRHGGKIEAFGEPDQGARFYFTLSIMPSELGAGR